MELTVELPLETLSKFRARELSGRTTNHFMHVSETIEPPGEDPFVPQWSAKTEKHMKAMELSFRLNRIVLKIW